MAKGKIAVPVVALLAAIAVGGWAWWESRERELSEKPLRVSEMGTPPPSTSTLEISATIPYSTIAVALNKVVASNMSGSGRQNICADLSEQTKKTIQEKIGGDVGRILGEVTKFVERVITVDTIRHVCQDVEYDYSVIRDGPVSVGRSNGALHLEVPVSASGRAGFSGDLAKALALDHKNFRGSIVALADVTIDLDANWCPLLKASTSYAWRDEAQFEIIHNVWLHIGSSVGPQLQKAMEDAVTKLQASITCEDVRKRVQDVWHPYSIALSVPDDATSIYLNLTPSNAAFSGVSYSDTAARLAVGLSAATELSISQIPTPVSPTAIPRLERVSSRSNRISLAVPIHAPWGQLSALATKLLANKTFERDTPGGHVKVRVSEVEIYPSRKQLALAVRFSASVQNRLLDVHGWAYLTADPVLDEKTQILKAKNVKLTREVDNVFWSVLSSVFEGEIRALIEKEAIYDLSNDIAKGREALQRALSDLASTQQVTATVTEQFAGLRQIWLGENALEVIVAFDGTAEVAVNAFPTGMME
jgi:hypothetical protein